MAAKKPLSKTVRNRLKLLPGTARQRIDPNTGIIYSRRQFEKDRVKAARRNAAKINRKYQQYIQIRDSYIAKQESLGKKIGKRQAMNSDELKTVVKKLHSKKPLDKKWALEQTTRGDKVKDWEPYIQRWTKGEL